MMRVATVLYEDKMQPGSGGAFPPHDFLLAMVKDLTGKEIWDLRRLIDKNPRKGHNTRDIYLNRAAFALAAAVRDCVKGKQASLGALVEMLAGLCGGAVA
jgi:hypothetical protein